MAAKQLPVEEHYYTNDDSDDDDDPSYDILEETRSGLSKLSLKKSKSRISQVNDTEESSDFVDVEVSKLDDKEEKSFEKVEKIIQAGQLEKLKVEECKIYLRKHGLRLTGNKNILIERIKVHLGVVDGGGERKYPSSSFVLNCKGDACTGDVVMFEQNVYEMFNIASRSATGPPCGTRVVAGRIVKESYGAAKQQHTFTVEVLWSKGVKALPPLHPLLIKGRNLYRLKTMRQIWVDEEKRRQILLEKHSRGSLARSDRETMVQEKEMRKMVRGEKPTRMKNRQQQSDKNELNLSQDLSFQPPNQQRLGNIQLQPTDLSKNLQPASTQMRPSQKNTGFSTISRQQHHFHQSFPNIRSPPRSPAHHIGKSHHQFQQYQTGLNHKQPSPLTSQINDQFAANDRPSHLQMYPNAALNVPPQVPVQRQVCRFYPQGRCYYGENCKYLHESKENGVMREQSFPSRKY
ncbi:hypothetical protein GIB67_040797 [Kingdonia uniflora]|uniref:Uncharacterized protein n=1 Tax=Kingdonia uniflora TaxID=39325 RepID=A0A7J7P599_9MAGN|nr:hypothetical protein GIB67_040797 [Kingdonia uniflora]